MTLLSSSTDGSESNPSMVGISSSLLGPLLLIIGTNNNRTIRIAFRM